MYDRAGQDRTGQDKTRQDRTGQDRTGQDRTRQDRTGQDKTGQDRTRQDRTGQDRTGQDRRERRGEDRGREDRTGQERTHSRRPSLSRPSRALPCLSFRGRASPYTPSGCGDPIPRLLGSLPASSLSWFPPLPTSPPHLFTPRGAVSAARDLPRGSEKSLGDGRNDEPISSPIRYGLGLRLAEKP